MPSLHVFVTVTRERVAVDGIQWKECDHQENCLTNPDLNVPWKNSKARPEKILGFCFLLNKVFPSSNRTHDQRERFQKAVACFIKQDIINLNNRENSYLHSIFDGKDGHPTVQQLLDSKTPGSMLASEKFGHDYILYWKRAEDTSYTIQESPDEVRRLLYDMTLFLAGKNRHHQGVCDSLRKEIWPNCSNADDSAAPLFRAEMPSMSSNLAMSGKLATSYSPEESREFYQAFVDKLMRATTSVTMIGSGIDLSSAFQKQWAYDYVRTLARLAYRKGLSIARIEATPTTARRDDWIRLVANHLANLKDVKITLCPNPEGQAHRDICLIDSHTTIIVFPTPREPGFGGGVIVSGIDNNGVGSQLNAIISAQGTTVTGKELLKHYNLTEEPSIGGQDKRYFYFSYGIDLDTQVIRQRAPESFGARIVRRLAVCKDHKLTFAAHGRTSWGPIPTIVPMENSEVVGCVYEICENDFNRLDFYHGADLSGLFKVPHQAFFSRRPVNIDISDVNGCDCFAYVWPAGGISATDVAAPREGIARLVALLEQLAGEASPTEMDRLRTHIENVKAIKQSV